MKTLAVFAGSKELPESKQAKLNDFLNELLGSVGDKVDRVIYGGGRYGVMGSVYDISKSNGLEIVGYSLEKYRKKDSEEGNEFFENDDERVKGFYRSGDLFLSLPGGLGVFKEVLQVNELIKRNGCGKQIYIPEIFGHFYQLMDGLTEENMIADEDRDNFIRFSRVSQMRL